jgi:hypothetical protein
MRFNLKLFRTSSPVIILAGFVLGCAHNHGAISNQSIPGVEIYSEVWTNPPQRLLIARVNLKNPGLHLSVAPGGPDPDGPGKWETTLMEPTKIAAREKFDFVVNGDFFVARGVNDREGTNSQYRAGQWAYTVGPAMTHGRTWSESTNPRPCLVIHRNRKVTIEFLAHPAGDDWEVVAGNVLLVQDGNLVTHTNGVRHPRTVVGLDTRGTRLTILVVDGRKPGVAAGMSYDELASEMIRLGCRQALNLDGGGSSVMAVRDRTAGGYRILNAPTDGRERAVANALGLSVNGD